MSTPRQWKHENEVLLRSLGVAINPHLPLIEAPQETSLRTPQEVARRVICLTAVVSRSLGDSREFLIDYVTQKGCYGCLSPREVAFLNTICIARADRIRFSWQVEALRVLLWALGKAELALPVFQQCEPHEDVFPHCSATEDDGAAYIEDAALRHGEELLRLSDLAYRAHWATRQHSLDGVTPIGSLNSGVVLEYHRAINWLTGHGGDDWDHIAMDT